MKNLKPVPADKKKSLGKLPTDVRNKMGYAKRGSMMKANKGSYVPKDMMKRYTPEESKRMSKDLGRKARLKKLLENRIKNTKPDSSDTKQKLKDALKKLGSAASPSVAAAKTIGKLAGAQISDKESERIRRSIPKKAKGGEMKKPMKAGLGAMVSKLLGKVIGKKSSVVNPTPGGKIMGEGKTPLTALYQKATEQQMAKKSMGGEMKKGYGAARQSGMGLQDENLIPGKSMDYYKDLM
jgi:hypothetical protein